MRNNYLETFKNTIPQSQKNRLLEVIKRQHQDVGVDPTDQELEKSLINLIAQLDAPMGEPLTKFRAAVPYKPLSSSDYNKTRSEGFTDLGSLYDQNNLIEKVITQHQGINKAVLTDIKSSLQNIIDELHIHAVVRENRDGFTDVKANIFRKIDNESKSIFYKAQVDTETASLKLPASVKASALTIEGRTTATIALNHLGGGVRGTCEQEKFNKERAVDGSHDTFWGEVILTDEPVKQYYNGALHFGVICEITINLSRTELINNIKFNPFTQYPLDILNIFYWDKKTNAWMPLNVAQRNAFTMEFNFKEVKTSQIKIVINQREANVNSYKLPKIFIRNVELWQQIVDRELSLAGLGVPEDQISQSMINQMTGWRAYLDALIKYKKQVEEKGVGQKTTLEKIFDSITTTLTGHQKKGAETLKLQIFQERAKQEEKLITIRKFEYTYGAYEIEINRRIYTHKGEYLSPKYVPTGPIILSELETTETTPQATAVEYSLSVDDKNWLNIAPKTTTDSGLTELLNIDKQSREAFFRFHAGTVSGVFRNGNVLAPTDYTLLQSGGVWSGVLIHASVYDAKSMYTVDYVPILASQSVDWTTLKPRKVMEEKVVDAGNREHSIELDKFPHIDFEKINSWTDMGDGEWISGGLQYFPLVVTVNGHKALNRTDYYDVRSPALTPFDVNRYPFYEFMQAGRRLWFNADIDGKRIRTVYSYLNNYIQLKIILRSILPGANSVTPEIKDYLIKLKTLY